MRVRQAAERGVVGITNGNVSLAAGGRKGAKVSALSADKVPFLAMWLKGNWKMRL